MPFMVHQRVKVKQEGRISHLKRRIRRFALKRGTYALSSLVIVTVRKDGRYKRVHLRFVAKDAHKVQ